LQNLINYPCHFSFENADIESKNQMRNVGNGEYDVHNGSIDVLAAYTLVNVVLCVGQVKNADTANEHIIIENSATAEFWRQSSKFPDNGHSYKLVSGGRENAIHDFQFNLCEHFRCLF